MGLQFRKRIRLLPGLWLNLSRRGISTSIGGDGLTVNLGKRGTRTTASLPGTGLRYVDTTTPTVTSSTEPARPARRTRPAFWLLLAVAIVGAVYVTNFL